MLSYQGYSGSVKFDADEEIFHGEVSGLRDVVTFQGALGSRDQAGLSRFDRRLSRTLPGDRTLTRQALFGSARCQMPPDLHRALHNLAAAEQVSLNRVIVKVPRSESGLNGIAREPRVSWCFGVRLKRPTRTLEAPGAPAGRGVRVCPDLCRP